MTILSISTHRSIFVNLFTNFNEKINAKVSMSSLLLIILSFEQILVLLIHKFTIQ